VKGLFSAFRFMTIFPIGNPENFDAQKMIPFFPVVGLFLGILLAGVDWAASRLWPQPVVCLLDVAFLVAATGAFHVDGAADTADGLLGHRSREKALAIMKDSRIGAMGAIAILCIFAVKWAGISGLHDHRALVLILVPAYARSAALFGIRFLEYGRPAGGTGYALFQTPLVGKNFLAAAIPAGLSILMGVQGIWLNVSFILITVLMIRFYKKRMGCITGDMLGAMIETTEALLFLAGAISISA
jgi:adenosylcobinamide-GDP ribazoletransferase